jgi:wyosine [tRNA(Phe)-imidazoG37] synthetase (radical SAM superfamily)
MRTYQDVVPVDKIVHAIQDALQRHKDLDYITFTANGEPTLYPHLSELLDEINHFKGNTKTLILSNAATIHTPQIQEALLKLDEVKLSLDCATQTCLKKLDRAHKSIEVEHIKKGMLSFKTKYKKPLVIEILFVKRVNDNPQEIETLNHFLKQLKPTRIDIGTIDRPPAYNVEPLTYEELHNIAASFDASLPLYIASRKHITTTPSNYSNERILETLTKRPLTKQDIEILLDKESQQRFNHLLQKEVVTPHEINGIIFFKKI